MMMMVVVVVVMMVPVAMRHHDDHRAAPVVMVMMVVVVMELSELNVVLSGRRRTLFIDCLQHRLGVRDRFQQIGKGIRLQYIRRRRCRCSLGSVQCSERRHRSQKSSDLLVHKVSSKAHSPGTQREPRAHVPRLVGGLTSKFVRLLRYGSSFAASCRNCSNSLLTCSGCSCCTQWPAPSTRWQPIILVQARVCIASKVPAT
jgi:hypothetical protein